MAEPSGEPVTLHLAGFDSHGTTRARYQGRWIEVEHGIPGEEVRAEVVGRKRLRGRIVDILQPSPDRVLPPCPYFREWDCGGCQWQQIAYPGQLAFKRAEINTALDDAGLDLAVTASHALPDPWRYRSSAGIALGKRAGFRRHGSLAIVPLHDCPISHPLIGQLMAILNDRLESGDLPDFHGRMRLEVRVCQRAPEDPTPGLQVLIRPTEGRPPQPDLDTLTATLAGLDMVAGLAWQQPNGVVTSLLGPLYARTDVAGKPVWLSAASFFQTNLLLLPELIARLQQEARPLAGKTVADVYGGVGVLGLSLAGEAQEVIEIESDPLAVKAGTRTAHDWGLQNVRFVAATAEQALTAAGQYDVVIVDPPRSGLSAPVLAALLERRPPLILYVSCLAESLARDLAQLLTSGYVVPHLELFDFYPQTYHVELLAVIRG